jgi:hypothetical protein
MPKSDQHARAIPDEVLDVVRSKLREVIDSISPYATPLTAQERPHLPRMGEKGLSFVEKSKELAGENPALRPNYLDMDAFTVDFHDATGLRTLRNNAAQVLELIDDIVLLAGSEAYQAALLYYNYVHELALRDVPGAKAIYEELRKRFPRISRRKGEAGA